MKTSLTEATGYIGKHLLGGYKAILQLKKNLLKGHIKDNGPIANAIIEDNSVKFPETQSNIQDAKTTGKVKVLIATFSQRGSTKKIADQIAKGLISSNFEVTHFPITANNIPDPNSFDIIGIGSSTYFFRPPYVVQDFMKKLKGLENKSSFVFITYGTLQGGCGNWIRNKLEKKGTHQLGYFSSHGADYWMGYVKRGVLFSPYSPNRQELLSAEIFGKVLAERYNDNVYVITKPDSALPLIYNIERMLVARPFSKFYSKTFKADENCNNCGICIQNCPVGNITQNGKITFHSNCILCATCELSCPQDAIHSSFDWKIFDPFMNYNIRHSKNKKIPYRKVIHKNGKTVPV